MKIFIAIGNDSLEEVVRTGPYEIVDAEENLQTLHDLLDFIQVEGLIINRLLDHGEGLLERISEKAVKKGIRVVVLVKDFTGYEERKIITGLVNVGVTAFMELGKVTGEGLAQILEKYPEKFDFGLFAETKVEYREVVHSVFKQVFTVYSPTGQGATTLAAHLAAALAKESNSSVCLLDYNPLKPWVARVMDTKAEFGLQQALDATTKGNLTPELIQGIVKQSKNIKNLSYMAGIYDINDYYTSTVAQYEEILQKLRFTFDYVVVDTHSDYDMFSSDVALRLADKVLVPIEADKYSIEHVNRMIKMFEQYEDYSIEKFKAIFNAYEGHNLTSIEAESSISIPVLGYITYNKAYRSHFNLFNHKKAIQEYIDIIKKLNVKASAQAGRLQWLLGIGRR